MRAWAKVASYIRNERDARKDPLHYGFFEHLTWLAHTQPPPVLRSKLRLKTMPEDWTFDRMEAFAMKEV